MTFIEHFKHKIVSVTDTDGKERTVCTCQVKDKHVTEDDKVEFPVYECSHMTRRYGFGTQNGIE